MYFFLFLFFFFFFFFVHFFFFFFFFSSRRRHTRCSRDWSSDVCSSDLLITRSISVPMFGGGSTGRAAKPVIPIASANFRYVSTEATTMRASTLTRSRSEERRVGKECRSRWSPEH